MNRVKKELRKRGVKLESDYPWMPYFIKGNSIFDRGYIFIDGVSVDSEKAKVRICYNTIHEVLTLKRNGKLEEDWD